VTSLVEISEDLKEIVSSTIDSIKEGMKDRNCAVIGAIEFELAVVKEKEAKGGFRFFIAEAGGNYSSGNVSRIKFQVIGSQTDARKLGMLWLHEPSHPP
jgi:hypothetical protein